MASLDALKTAGKLFTWPPKTNPPNDMLCDRTFYYTAEWRAFLMTLDRAYSERSRSLSELARIGQVCNAFCTNETIKTIQEYGKTPLFQVARGGPNLWELSTPTTRTFGWFACPNVFVAVSGGKLCTFKDSAGNSINDEYVRHAGLVEDWHTAYDIQSSEKSTLTDINELVTDAKLGLS